MRHLLSSTGRALFVLLTLTACDDVAGDEALRERPGIEVGERRCGPVEVGPFGRVERLIPLPDGEIYLVGNNYNRYRLPTGRVVQFDPTGAQRPLSYRLGWPAQAVALTEQGLITGMDGVDFYRWTRDDFEQPTHLGSYDEMRRIAAVDLVPVDSGHLVVGSSTKAIGREIPTLIRFDPATGRSIWHRPYLGQGPWSALTYGGFTGIVASRDGSQIIAVGHGRPLEETLVVAGFVMRVDARTGDFVAHKQYLQVEYEPQRLLLDRMGEPVVLAIEGHSGFRYEAARPFMARIAADGSLFDERHIELPDGTTQGALLAGHAMPDGGWLLGGSACGEARAWCQAWLLRTDARGDVVWSRMVARDVAATVTDLHVVGNRVIAAVSSSLYCCEFDELDYDGWLWELDLDGNCPLEPGLKRDGYVFR